jgi:hypothetical protein
MFLLKTLGSGYSQRTRYNCKTADFTVALAFDFKSAGELLTAKLAKPRLYQLHISEFNQEEVDEFCRKYRGYMCDTLHIAGNGAYTLYKHLGVGYQAVVDKLVLGFLELAVSQVKIQKVYSGFQTGVDEAGAKAALKLGIPLEITMPEGYRIRDYKNKDRYERTELKVLSRLLGTANLSGKTSTSTSRPSLSIGTRT